MVVEESVLIHALPEKVWKTFTDLSCWGDWNTVLRDVSAGGSSIEEGGRFRCSIRPFFFPVHLDPVIEEVIPREKIVWAGTKYGVSSRHEFIFESDEGGVFVVSRETFSGIAVEAVPALFPEQRIRELTRLFLRDLKEEAESV
jgi:hypothetical protein